ncbi:hypothetical protein WJX72_008610 [[Myrmecia] bisecta]|uniref:AAA+ ATPase domain-containing protein n=1 Tax=[Myrmecia] bisecta TaxID=41462 RepID=A0AAW1Q1L1_9CHLO
MKDHLLHKYKEYQRRQRGPFRKMVATAVEMLKQQGVSAKQEVQLQAQEQRHLSRQARSGNGGAASSGSESDSDHGSSSGSEPELEGDLEALLDQGTGEDGGRRLNSSLLSMYSSVKEKGGARGFGSSSDGEGSSQEEKPAFAPPHVVAAAAARALAAEAEARAAKKGLAGRTAGGAATPAAGEEADQPSTSGRKDQPTPSVKQLPNGGPTPAPPATVTSRVRVVAEATNLPNSAAKTPARDPPALPAVSEPPGTAVTVNTVQTTDTQGKSCVAGKAGQPAGRRARGGDAKRQRMSVGGRGSSLASTPREVNYDDLGGIENILQDIEKAIERPFMAPMVYDHLGVEPPRGVLLHGPPGCGKTALANAIANECGVKFYRISAPEIVSGMSGESEAKLRQLFEEASNNAPAIIFIDEIDAIATKRESAQREMERRIVAQMLTCLDDLARPVKRLSTRTETEGDKDEEDAAQPRKGHVVVIAATNRPDAIDTALRRAGRFDYEVAMGIPTEEARARILQVMARKLRLSGDFDFRKIAKQAPGFVGADLASLVKEAAALAIDRIFEGLKSWEPQADAAAGELAQAGAIVAADASLPRPIAAPPDSRPKAARSKQRLVSAQLTPEALEGLAITMADFEAAVKRVQPSIRREGFATTPDVTWADVGSLHEVRAELFMSTTFHIAHPELYTAMGVPNPSGVLLYGPPGCGKTLVAKAAASESGANFISIKGPELLNKFVGESEKAVRTLFERARAAKPCVVFFDEMDALVPRRGSDNNQSSERLVNQLLAEMDGVDGRQGVYLIGATNRPDMIDPALLRPGRLDKLLYVPLPPPEGRVSILQALTRKTPLAPEVDIAAIGLDTRCSRFSGADLAALVKAAVDAALKEVVNAAFKDGVFDPAALLRLPSSAGQTTGQPPAQLHPRHFDTAFHSVSPSVSVEDQRSYERQRRQLRSSLGHLKRSASTAAVPAPAAVAVAVPVNPASQAVDGSVAKLEGEGVPEEGEKLLTDAAALEATDGMSSVVTDEPKPMDE